MSVDGTGAYGLLGDEPTRPAATASDDHDCPYKGVRSCCSTDFCEDCICYDPAEEDDGADLDPCNYCPHDNTDHRGDGCLHCGCDVPQ